MFTYRKAVRFYEAKTWDGGVLNLHDLAFITDETHVLFAASEIKEGDVLLNITGASIGRSAIADITVARFGTDPHGFIGRFQAIEGNGKTAAALAVELFDILCQHRQTRKRISEAVMECFKQSHSYRCAKENLDLLEKLNYWDSSLSSSARSALKSNPQISDAWGVSERLNRFIERMEKDTSTD